MASADIENDQIKIQINYREKPLIETLPGATFRRGSWHMPTSWASCQALRGVFGQHLTVGPELAAWSRHERASRIDPALFLRDKIEAPEGYRQQTILDPELRDYQIMGVSFMLAAGSGILGDEMGVGKTVQALQFIEAHEPPDVIRPGDDPISYGTDNPALPALIIVPNSTKYHWSKLATRWCPSGKSYVIDGSAAKRRKILDAAKADPRALVIISLEQTRSMSRLAPFGSIKLKRCRECDPKRGDDLKPAQCEVHPKELNAMAFSTVILDEAHRIKDPKSKQTRAVWQLMHAPDAKYRWGLTGTPISSHVGDLWSILHAVAPEDWPVKSRYVDRYCLAEWNTFGGVDIIGLRPDTRDEFFRIFDPRFRRVLKSEVLTQLPPITREIRYCELTPAMRRTYEDLRGGLSTRLPDGQLMIAWNDMTKQGMLQRIASSAVEIDKPDPDDMTSWKITPKNPSPKIDALMDLLDDLGVMDPDNPRPPVVVAAESRPLVDMAHERLAATHVRVDKITGDTDTITRQNLLEALKDGALDVLLFTIKAGGVGLDMQAADTLIFMQQPWSMIERLQTEARVHRFGSEIHNSVKIIDLVTSDTVEDDQIQRVHEKLEKLEEITRDRERRAAAKQDTRDLDLAEGRIVSSEVLRPDEEVDKVMPGFDAVDYTQQRSDVATAGDESWFAGHDGVDDHGNEVWYRPDTNTAAYEDGAVIQNPVRPSNEIVDGHRYTDTTGVEWGHPGPREACTAPECAGTGTDPGVSVAIPSPDDAGRPAPYLISASKMRDWLRCRRKWWLTWVRGLALQEDLMGARATGTRIHAALAGYYVPEDQQPVDPRDGLEVEIEKDWQRLIVRCDLTEDHPDYEAIKAKWNGVVSLERAMVEGYMEWLEETGADSGLTFVSAEEELTADVDTVDNHGRLFPVRFMGRLDARMIRDVDGARLFEDHKTTANFARMLKMISMDPQILMYHLLEWLNSEEGEARCDGALYNMLRKVKRTAAAKPPFYERETIRVNQVQIDNFKEWALACARDMAEAEERLTNGNDPLSVVYPSPGDDCSWMCDFYPVCPLFNDGSRAEDMLSGVYHETNPWSRYDRMTEGDDQDA